MDELFAYQIPHSIEAEQSVIGSMLIDERCIPDLLQKLAASDFYSSLNRDIFKKMAGMYDAGETLDPILLRDKLVCEDYSKAEAGKYILELMEVTPTAANALAYADIVREKATLRAAQAAALDAIKLAAESGAMDELQDALQKAMDATDQRGRVEVISLTTAAVALYGELGSRYESEKNVAGLKTGYTELDSLMGGLRAGTMVVLAARSGMGKSALALSLAVETAKRNKCTALIFSLEMSAVELCERVFANYGDMNLNKIRDGQLGEGDWHKLSSAASSVSSYDVRIVEAPVLGMEDMVRICRREKPALVIIDHIGLIRPSGKYRDRREAVDAISRSIKQTAKDLNIPIIAVAQLNRAVMGRSNKKPQLSDLRESGAIEQDADAVLLIHRPHYYDDTAEKTDASLIIAKNRSGKTATIPMLWYGSRQRFTEDWVKLAEAAESADDAGNSQEELPL